MDFLYADGMRNTGWVNQLLATMFLPAMIAMTVVPQPYTVKPKNAEPVTCKLSHTHTHTDQEAETSACFARIYVIGPRNKRK